jgi:hypothetical protein
MFCDDYGQEVAICRIRIALTSPPEMTRSFSRSVSPSSRCAVN